MRWEPRLAGVFPAAVRLADRVWFELAGEHWISAIRVAASGRGRNGVEAWNRRGGKIAGEYRQPTFEQRVRSDRW
jgi:hypothetical protein